MLHVRDGHRSREFVQVVCASARVTIPVKNQVASELINICEGLGRAG